MIRDASLTEACLVLSEACGADFSEEQLFGWTAWNVNGGIVIARENEIHAAAPVQCRGLWIDRKAIRGILGSMLDVYGVVKTMVRRSNEDGHRFVARLGFEVVDHSDDTVFYELRRDHAIH